MAATTGRTPRHSPLVTLAERLVGHTSIFAVGTGIGLVLSIARLAILTRLLAISIYGELTLLIVLAGFITMFVRATIVTGSLRASFRGGGGDEDDGDDDDGDDPGFEEKEEMQPGALDRNPRRVLGTGLMGSLLLTGLLVALVAAFARPIDAMLINSGKWLPVVAATLYGGLEGGSFRLVSQIPRYERRPVTYVVLQVAHAILGLVMAIALIEAGYGLAGAIGGLALGSALSTILGLWVSRHRFSFALDFGVVATLPKLGAPLIGITLGSWLFRQTDIVMISHYLPSSDIALYRVAARIAAIVAAMVGSLLFAWGPLVRGPLRGALHREGLITRANARFFTYFWLLAVWLTVILVLTKDLLIRIAPASYYQAAYLIAFLGVASLSMSGLLVSYRTSRMRRKRLWLTGLMLGMSPVLVGLCIVLIPRFGLDGAAAASIAAPLLSAATYMLISQRISPEPLDVPWAKLILATFLGIGYSALFVLVVGRMGDTGIALEVAGSLAFPILLVLSGAVPRRDARTILRLLTQLPRRQTPSFEDGLVSLDDRDVEVLHLLLRVRRAPGEVARETNRDEDELLERLVRVLRDIGEVGQPKPTDVVVGRYLLSPTSNGTLRDREGQMLVLRHEVDSMEVDQLSALTDVISKLSESQWLSLTSRDAPSRETGV